jgi:uncharacterized protein YecE (DUF72 family)
VPPVPPDAIADTDADMVQAALFATAPAVAPAAPAARWIELAEALHARWSGRLHLGTSSWHFPGWAGWVWAAPRPAGALSALGLPAYAAHPLLSTVSLDRAFYRTPSVEEYRRLAVQARQGRPGFRFVVKAPAALSDAVLRESGSGKALRENAGFLDPGLALREAWAPAAEGLGESFGVWVLQVSPLPARWLHDPESAGGLYARLEALFGALNDAARGREHVARLALELRDASLLTPALARRMKRLGVRLCLGLHDRMPEAEVQLPIQRAMWPGDLVCRWNLQRGQRYAEARDAWAPFDRLVAPDEATRRTLARIAAATLDAGHRAFVTVNNKAEGCAPASVLALAEALLAEPRAELRA